MPTKTCPNGHQYDSDIYGDECPLCPKGSVNPVSQSIGGGMPPFGGAEVGIVGGATHVGGSHAAQQPAQGPAFINAGTSGPKDPAGETHLPGHQAAKPMTGGTVIRHAAGAQMPSGRKLVGFLVTYNRNPLGKSYNIYEGKNYVGRDPKCDIAVPEDNQMSGRHMSILYRNVDNKFKFRDEQSSNGTFINKELTDEGELQNYDIIRLGGTVFIFIAIPKL